MHGGRGEALAAGYDGEPGGEENPGLDRGGALVGKVREGGGDLGGGVVVGIVKCLLARGRGGAGEGVGDGAVGEDGEVHDGSGIGRSVLRGDCRELHSSA